MAQKQVRKQKATSRRQTASQEREVTGPRPEVRKDVQRTWWPSEG